MDTTAIYIIGMYTIDIDISRQFILLKRTLQIPYSHSNLLYLFQIYIELLCRRQVYESLEARQCFSIRSKCVVFQACQIC